MARVVVGLSLVAILLLAGSAAQALDVGDPAANFILTDTTGQQHQLSDYLGQVVVLFFVGYG